MLHFISEIWDRATTAQPVPSATVVLLTGLTAVALVLVRPTWLRVRLGITVVHEGGHAAVAVLTGRRLQGIRVHSDTSGLMTSRGKPRGPGMVATLLAGYLAPTALGLLAATLVGAGYAVGLLWLAVVLMVGMLFWIRNAYGFLALGVGIVVAGAISWYAGGSTQSAVAYLLVWLLLFAAPRPVVELLAAGRRRSRDSDPDQLARITWLPAIFWILLLLVGNVAGLVAGASLLATALNR